MRAPKKPAGPGKPAPNASEEAEMAVLSFLFTRKPTPEENRLAVRHLLRKTSQNLERSK